MTVSASQPSRSRKESAAWMTNSRLSFAGRAADRLLPAIDDSVLAAQLPWQRPSVRDVSVVRKNSRSKNAQSAVTSNTREHKELTLQPILVLYNTAVL